MFARYRLLFSWCFAVFASAELSACSDANPRSYTFASKFDAKRSSVAYSGQTLRHVLIADLNLFLGQLDDRLRDSADSGYEDEGDAGGLSTEAKIVRDLNFYFEFDENGQSVEIASLSPASSDVDVRAETTYGSLSGEAKDLRGKARRQRQ